MNTHGQLLEPSIVVANIIHSSTRADYNNYSLLPIISIIYSSLLILRKASVFDLCVSTQKGKTRLCD